MTTPTSGMDDDAWERFAAEDEFDERDPETGINPAALRWLALALGALIAVGVVALWPSGEAATTYRQQLNEIGIPREFVEAEIVDAVSSGCEFEPTADCKIVTFLILEGEGEGTTFEQFFPETTTTPSFAEGEVVVLAVIPGGQPGFEYQFADRERSAVLWALLLLFAAAVIILGRWQGMAALAGLGLSVLLLVLFVLPAILDGRSPVLVAIVGASAIAFAALYLTHGVRDLTTVALVGTLSALLLTALLSGLVLELAQISGFASEEAVFLSLLEGIDIRALVLAGTVLGAAGALDDVTITQASAVWELRSANVDIDRMDLFGRGLRIGRDHVASTVNTLFLAYAGAALPLLVLLVVSEQSAGSIANSEVIAIEIIRTLVGSIGLVAAVPLTTWLAAMVARPTADAT